MKINYKKTDALFSTVNTKLGEKLMLMLWIIFPRPKILFVNLNRHADPFENLTAMFPGNLTAEAGKTTWFINYKRHALYSSSFLRARLCNRFLSAPLITLSLAVLSHVNSEARMKK